MSRCRTPDLNKASLSINVQKGWRVRCDHTLLTSRPEKIHEPLSCRALQPRIEVSLGLVY